MQDYGLQAHHVVMNQQMLRFVTGMHTICLTIPFYCSKKGLLVKWSFWRPPQDRKCFDDQAFWEASN